MISWSFEDLTRNGLLTISRWELKALKCIFPDSKFWCIHEWMTWACMVFEVDILTLRKTCREILGHLPEWVFFLYFKVLIFFFLTSNSIILLYSPPSIFFNLNCYTSFPSWQLPLDITLLHIYRIYIICNCHYGWWNWVQFKQFFAYFHFHLNEAWSYLS